MHELAAAYLVGVLWLKSISHEWRMAAGVVCNERRGICQSDQRLCVKITLYICAGKDLGPVERGLLVTGSIDLLNAECVGLVNCIWTVLLQKYVHVGAIVCLSEIVGQAHLVLARCSWGIIEGSVKGAETGGSDIAATASLSDRLLLARLHVYHALHCLFSEFNYGLQGSSTSRWAEEGIGRLDGVDVLVQMRGQRPRGCADELGSVLVLVDGVLGVQQGFNGADRKIDIDPVLGR